MRWPLVWGLEVLRPWRSCVMLRSMTRSAWTGCVAQVPDYFEIPPFFPFTRGYLILAFDGMARRAEDGRELIDCPVVSFQST